MEAGSTKTAITNPHLDLQHSGLAVNATYFFFSKAIGSVMSLILFDLEMLQMFKIFPPLIK